MEKHFGEAMKIHCELLINAPINKVYSTYADIATWKKVLDDVVDVTVHYDDALHQEFDMTVQRPSGQETVHAVRFCYPEASIEMFQTKPPPYFKSMSGVWKFEATNNGTLVQASRNFELKEDANFDSQMLEKFLAKNLASFKQWIECSA